MAGPQNRNSPLRIYRMAWATQAPRTPDIGPSVTFAIKAAQNRATKKLNTSNSRQFQVIVTSLIPPINRKKPEEFQTLRRRTSDFVGTGPVPGGFRLCSNRE
jgi:hypothetical protein